MGWAVNISSMHYNKGVCADRRSSILGVWAAPTAPRTLPGGGLLGPPGPSRHPKSTIAGTPCYSKSIGDAPLCVYRPAQVKPASPLTNTPLAVPDVGGPQTTATTVCASRLFFALWGKLAREGDGVRETGESRLDTPQPSNPGKLFLKSPGLGAPPPTWRLPPTKCWVLPALRPARRGETHNLATRAVCIYFAAIRAQLHFSLSSRLSSGLRGRKLGFVFT